MTPDDPFTWPKDLFPKRYGYTIRALIRECLKQRCNVEHDYLLSRFGRYRLTAKAVVCLALRREGSVYCAYPGPDDVEVAHMDTRSGSGPDGTWWSWDGVAVTLGWRHWRVEAFSDGAP